MMRSVLRGAAAGAAGATALDAVVPHLVYGLVTAWAADAA
jgi:hypothetical protein